MDKECVNRCEELQKIMKREGVDGAVVSVPVNILYFFGKVFVGYLYIPQSGEPQAFVRRPAGIECSNVHYIRKVEQLVEYGCGNTVEGNTFRLMVETDELPYSDCIRISKALGATELVGATRTIRTIRSVKSPFEQEEMRRGARLQSEALLEVRHLYRKGMTDHEFAVEVERVFRLKGCLGIFRTNGYDMESYMGSVLAGDNAGTPSPYDFALGGAGMHQSFPLGHNGTLLSEGMAVMVDINGNFNGYIADQSRTFSVGRLPDMAYYAHNVSIEIQDEIMRMAGPGTVCEDVMKLTLDIVEKRGLSDCFMGKKQQAKFVGHGIGLTINELPVLCDRNKAQLEVGNIIALEPKFIIDGVGAVGCENSYIITTSGLEKITTAPEEIISLV